jgi:ketosteroid isomerase-like protein
MDEVSKNREFMLRHFEAINRRDIQTVVGNMLPDLYDHELEGDHQHDIEEGARRLQALLQRIPDLSVEIRDVIADKNTAVVRGVWSGREVETGKKLEFHGFVQWRIRDGKLAERWATVTPLAAVSEIWQRW